MPEIAKLKLPNGSYEDHLLIRSKEYKEIKTMQNPAKYREQQNSSSIDTLNNALTSLENEVKSLEQQLNLKVEQRDITTDVLRKKLEAKLNELHSDDEDLIVEPKPAIKSDLNQSELDKLKLESA